MMAVVMIETPAALRRSQERRGVSPSPLLSYRDAARSSLGLLGGRDRWPLTGRPVPLWVRGLAYFDQMTVGIADVTTDLVLVLFRWRQELSTACAPLGVHGVDVSDPNIEEAADPVGISGRLQGDLRLVVGRASADIDDDPTVGKCDIGQSSGAGEGDPAAEHFGVEAPRAIDIVRHDEVGQHNPLWGRWGLGHLYLRWLGRSPVYDGRTGQWDDERGSGLVSSLPSHWRPHRPPGPGHRGDLPGAPRRPSRRSTRTWERAGWC